MNHPEITDEAIVDKARRLVQAKSKFRSIMLIYAVVFLGMSAFFTVRGIQKVNEMDGGQMTPGVPVWFRFGNRVDHFRPDRRLMLGKIFGRIQLRLASIRIACHLSRPPARFGTASNG